jgi:tRNA(fMet)-specific endonuclease VapC
MLDTNVVVDVQRGKALSVAARFALLSPGEAAISVIAYGELLHGAEKSADVTHALHALAFVLRDIPVLPLTFAEARIFGRLLVYLHRRGEAVGLHDLWIAAHAIAEDLTLVTSNEREFRRVPGLKFENWTK